MTDIIMFVGIGLGTFVAILSAIKIGSKAPGAHYTFLFVLMVICVIFSSSDNLNPSESVAFSDFFAGAAMAFVIFFVPSVFRPWKPQPESKVVKSRR